MVSLLEVVYEWTTQLIQADQQLGQMYELMQAIQKRDMDNDGDGEKSG